MNNHIDKAKSGIRWIGLGQIANRFLSICSTVILARLLLPEEFGTIALARLVLGFFMLFSSWGINSAIIVEEKNINNVANASFWINFAIMLFLAILILIISPLASKFYETPILTPILHLLAIGLILQSFELVPQALLAKELRYNILTKVSLLIELISGSLVILLAFLGFGVWSLVIPQILSSPIRSIFYWKITKWKPSFQINQTHIKNVFHFGKNILGSELVRYLNQNTDYFFIGRMLDSIQLGYYTFAYRLANWPVENIVKIVNTVSLPTLSKYQDDIAELKRMFLKMIGMVSLITFPIFGILFGITHELIIVAFGEKWLPAENVLKILLIFGLMRAIFSPTGRIFLILKKTHLLLVANLVQFPFLVFGVWYGIKNYSIIGSAYAVSIVLSLGGTIYIALSNKLLNIKFHTFFKQILPGLVSSTMSLVICYFFKIWLFDLGLPSVFIVFFYLPVLFIIYNLFLFLLFKPSFYSMMKIIADILGITKFSLIRNFLQWNEN